MPLLTWKSQYSVGIAALDEQHTEFIALMNELHAALLEGQTQNASRSLLARLMTYAHDHFSTEERLMESTDFPGLAEHRAEHQALLFKVEEFAVRLRQGDRAVCIELLNFLSDWLTHHLQHMDSKYSAWLNEHGVC